MVRALTDGIDRILLPARGLVMECEGIDDVHGCTNRFKQTCECFNVVRCRLVWAKRKDIEEIAMTRL